MIKEADLPEGWPDATPVGKIQVKAYPAYRAAEVRKAQVNGTGQGPMFRQLFQHIKRNEISMTAPVEMSYENFNEGDFQVVSMAFLYANHEQGQVCTEDLIEVRDFEPKEMASIGARGGYTESNFEKRIAKLDAWLAKHAEEWEVAGPPRLLGYNSPFIPSFMRYSEVQVPVRPMDKK